VTPQVALQTLKDLVDAYVPSSTGEYDQALRAIEVLERYRNPDAEALAALVTFVVDIEHDARRALNGLERVSEKVNAPAGPMLAAGWSALGQ